MYYHYFPNIGTLEVICGSMFSGKSEELIRRIKRAIIAKQNTIVFKPTIDQRYHTNHVSSHDGNHIKAINIKDIKDILEHITPAVDVVGIDEVQFIQGDVISVIKGLVADGKRVICAGLDMDFRGEPFGLVPNLLSIADDVTKLKAICMVCGHPAHFTQRLVDGQPAHFDDPLILIGAKESYEARCRNCYRLADNNASNDVVDKCSMNTVIIPNNETQDLSLAAHVLRQGGLVAMPTETVYGLAANALDATAVNKIFKAKGRPSDNPLIVHIGCIDQLNDLVVDISDKAKQLIDAFWPGPLTLVFKASELIPSVVSAGLSTVAIRYPSHPIAKELINLSGLPLAAPSANTSGKPSPTTAGRVIEDLAGKIEVIIDGGRVEVGLESTVVDVTSDIPVILRPGKITQEMMEDIVGQVAIDPALINTLKNDFIPKAPGMKYTHYSPNADVYIVEGNQDEVINAIDTLASKAKLEGKKVGIMATDETISYYTQGDINISLGSKTALDTIAHGLFETLRAFDDANIDIVYTEGFPHEGIGEAIMNRLTKAASNNIIQASSINK